MTMYKNIEWQLKAKRNRIHSECLLNNNKPDLFKHNIGDVFLGAYEAQTLASETMVFIWFVDRWHIGTVFIQLDVS